MTADSRGGPPLSYATTCILLALAEGDLHGYAIKQAVEQLTQGRVRLGPGTLYEAIQRLASTGLVQETARPRAAGLPATGKEAQRRYYRITPAGLRVLRAELRHLDRLVVHARANALLGPERAR
jgi:DNA-binding PadR family transcriptional regulator